MTADYNGWNDQPEAEREAVDQLELPPLLQPKDAATCRVAAAESP